MPEQNEKTAEQIAAEKAALAEQKAAEKEAKRQQREAEQAAKREQKEAEKAAKAEAREKERAEKAAAKEAEKAARKAEREAKREQAIADKEARKAEREANRMPEQNGVRRPKPDTLCGKAWATADELSASLGQPVPIAVLLERTNADGLNEGNVKAEYARWRKFHGIVGRVSLPKAEPAPAKEADSAAE